VGSGLGPLIDDEDEPLEHGTQLTLRETWRGRVIAARPVRVVDDVPHHHRSYWFAPGTHWKNDPRGEGEVRFLDGPWDLEDRVLDHGVLSFSFPETAYVVLMQMDVGGRFEEYYVNIQSPLRPWGGGFDYIDWFLDVRIPADRHTYAWKDEAELDEAVRRGLVTSSEARDIRWAGERAIEHILLREPPFDLDWNAWEPDPEWSSPVSLAPGWDRADG
jgi:uncharacterized protein